MWNVNCLPISRKHQIRIAAPNTIKIVAKVVVGVSLMQSGCFPFGKKRATTPFDQLVDFIVPATMMQNSMIAYIQYVVLVEVSYFGVFRMCMKKLLAFMNVAAKLMFTPSPTRLSFFGVQGVGVVYEMCVPIPVSKIAGIFSRGIVFSDMILGHRLIYLHIYAAPLLSMERSSHGPHIRTHLSSQLKF